MKCGNVLLLLQTVILCDWQAKKLLSRGVSVKVLPQVFKSGLSRRHKIAVGFVFCNEANKHCILFKGLLPERHAACCWPLVEGFQ